MKRLAVFADAIVTATIALGLPALVLLSCYLARKALRDAFVRPPLPATHASD